MAKNTEVAVVIAPGEDDVTSWDEAIERFGDTLAVANSRDLVDKGSLVGVPFIVTAWMVRTDKVSGRDYVSVEVVTEDGRALVFNDGSTGVYRQLEGDGDNVEGLAVSLGRRGGVVCRKGLRVSEYDAPDSQGKMVHAKTYYLA